MTSRIIEESKIIKKEIEGNRKQINNIVLEFEADDLNIDDVDKNLKTIVKRGKDAVVSTIKKETSSMLSTIEKYDDLLNYNIEVSQTLKKMGDTLGLHTRVMHAFARKYAEKLKEEFARLTQNRNLLQSLINEQEEFRKQSEDIFESIRKIEMLDSVYSQKNKRLTEVVNEKEQASRIIANLEHNIAELKSKKAYQEFLEIKKKIELLSGEKNEIKRKIDGQFSKISRPLSKYMYVSAFEKPMKKMMEELGSNPYQVISSQNKDAIIEILEATTKSVLAGNVSVKDSDKAVEQIKETIHMLDEFLMLKETYVTKLTILESDLRVFDVALLESKDKDLQKTRSNLSDLEVTSKKLKAEIEENRTQANTARSELETSLSRLAKTKMTIKF